MSAFRVQDKTINQIVGFLKWRFSQNKNLQTRDEIAMKLEIDFKTDTEAGRKLAELMAGLNRLSLITRYANWQGLYGEPFVYCQESGANVFQTIKSLHCWTYQCDEGNLHETSRLYRIMERLASSLAYEVVSEMPEYQEAVWD